jgi:Spx/MgsR family transcriptional regulator
MAMKVEFYCWVKCSTCRKAKEFLSQKNVEINERDFFKIPFSRAEIEELLQGKPASEMFNFRSPSFKALGLEQDKLSEKELIDLMLKEPRLIRRPVVRINGKVYFSADRPVLEDLIN